MFLRDRKNQPVGCVAIKIVKNDGTGNASNQSDLVVYAVSTLNPLDQFDRKIARQLALGRMVEDPNAARIRSNASIHDISKVVMHSITHNPTLPNRARQAANLWLKNNRMVHHQHFKI
jgi:hypothetical protein